MVNEKKEYWKAVGLKISFSEKGWKETYLSYYTCILDAFSERHQQNMDWTTCISLNDKRSGIGLQVVI